jgi:glucosamine--fructose-6-phosphate aminotransferase (isomerizing)
MFAEAAEAPVVAERQLSALAEPLAELGDRLRHLNPRLVTTCARGSSDHAATFAKYLFESRALAPVASYSPSISSIYKADPAKLAGTLFLAISQSGRSPDLVLSAEAARDAGALVVALVNDVGSPLAAAAEITLPMGAGPERSVAATKSYIGSLLALVGIAQAWSGDEDLGAARTAAPLILREAWAQDWSAAIPALRGASNLYVLGRGLNLGVAQEAALKLKETCGIHAEAFSLAEVRHGPMALVGPDFPVLMIVPPDEARSGFEALAAEFAERGAPVLAAGKAGLGTIQLAVDARVPAMLAPAAAIMSFYRLANALSLARGLHPDRPPHLKKVTETR